MTIKHIQKHLHLEKNNCSIKLFEKALHKYEILYVIRIYNTYNVNYVFIYKIAYFI